ncbi:MAG TPA: hypothetical protein PK327_08005 [Niabella sp.]|nr:hypothetical protein [Niabella sp.]HRB90375.1 hypothetical protein [Niabella sp.]HRB94943.1 hypothetical protein [Niabella sp.]HRC10760.1 hypothetical protein [Niabella sp.]
MQIINARDRQTPIDVAMQHTGSVDTLVVLCVDNDLSVTEEMYNGQPLMVRAVRNKFAALHFKTEQLMPVSKPEAMPEGISHWRVGMDWVV